jgi:hypothetical protein
MEAPWDRLRAVSSEEFLYKHKMDIWRFPSNVALWMLCHAEIESICECRAGIGKPRPVKAESGNYKLSMAPHLWFYAPKKYLQTKILHLFLLSINLSLLAAS